jgi:hypothetical protein
VTDVGAQFVKSLAVKDREGLIELFAPSVDFRGMTPGRFWEAATPAEVVDTVLFGNWFETHDDIEAITHLETGRHVDRERVDYCLRIRSRDDLCMVEQRGYFDLDDNGRIAKMNLVCSGFRKVDDGSQRMTPG